MKKLLLILTLFSAWYTQAESVALQADRWTAWGNGGVIDIKRENGEITFARRDQKNEWNTPRYAFPADNRITVSANTILKFEYKVNRSGNFEINIGSADENNNYSTSVHLEAGQWQSAEVALGSAKFKSRGRNGKEADGLVGDRISSLQIAYKGAEIILRNVQICENVPSQAPAGTIAIPTGAWQAWGNGGVIDIKRENGEIAFTRRDQKNEWNTPRYVLPADSSITVSANTILKFEYKVNHSGDFEVNINSADENNNYSTSVYLEAGQWRSVEVALGSAKFKSRGRNGKEADGLVGDRISSLQIAYKGAEIILRNVQIYEDVPPQAPAGVIAIPIRAWQAWGNNATIRISVSNGEISFRRSTQDDGWNTPMYTFPAEQQPAVTALTFIRFEYKASRPRRIEFILNNAAEGTQYSVPLNLETGGWKSAAVHLNSSVYKRGGRTGVSPDGMAGDKLAGIQIAYSGVEITIRNVQIFEADPSDPGLVTAQNPAVAEYIANRPQVNYRQFANGAVFPFGIIHAVRQAEKVNGEFFSQSPDERREENYRLIRLTGFNTYSNFCEIDPQNITRRLDSLRKYDLLILETATCSSGFVNLPADSPLIQQVAANGNHPQLLAYYGQDEPVDSALYIRNKQRIESLQNGAPLTSGMHMMSIVRELAPAMDVTTIDVYSLAPSTTPAQAVEILDNHARLVGASIGFSKTKRVWFVGQAFSLRAAGKEVFRFPTAAEMRYDVFNTIAAGANGYFGFIWQDQTAYLRADSRKGESFDYTVCDPWGNISPAGQALGDTGRRVVPVMSFFLDRRRPEKSREIPVAGNVFTSEWVGEYGTLFIAVNRNLLGNSNVRLNIPLNPGEKLYDLDRLAESDGSLSLQPGDGAFLLAATPEKFAALKTLISERRAREAELRRRLTIEDCPELIAAREAFGRMNLRMLAALDKFDGNPEMDPLREKIRALSKEYFDALRLYRTSGEKAAGLATLAARVDQLQAP